jgi:triacylglycerol lipase
MIPLSFLTEFPEELYAPDALRGFAPAVGFGIANARAMMWLAQLAYEESPEKIGRIGKLWGMEVVERIPGAISTKIAIQDTVAVVLAGPAAVVVSFAGTDPLKVANWITNLTLDPLPGETHRGFQEAADAIWAKLGEAVRTAMAARSAPALFFTGHSLGGALAVLGAEKAARDHVVSAVYTYGMPRVGTATFQARYAALADRTYRLHFGRDLVPGVPTPEQGYRHVGLYLHCPAGRFADLPASAMGPSDEPAVVSDLLAEVRVFLQRPSSIAPSIVAHARMLLPGHFNPAPQIRPDFLGVILEQLPPPIRDHVPHRYLGAL